LGGVDQETLKIDIDQEILPVARRRLNADLPETTRQIGNGLEV
jgi:hypothetical protein